MSLKLRILQIDVPESDLTPVTAFWAQALSAEPVDAPGAFTHLVDATSALEVHVQALHVGPPRYHLDFESVAAPGHSAAAGGGDANDAARHAELARLIELGGREVEVFDAGYTVFADPAGLRHCVIDRDASTPTRVAPPHEDRGYLCAVFLDVPAEHVDAEVAFYADALEVTAQPPEEPGSPYTELSGVTGPGGPVSVVVQAVDATARVHVDLSAPNVQAEAQRLLRLGATHVADVEDWIILADPVGNLLCVVPRGEV